MSLGFINAVHDKEFVFQLFECCVDHDLHVPYGVFDD